VTAPDWVCLGLMVAAFFWFVWWLSVPPVISQFGFGPNSIDPADRQEFQMRRRPTEHEVLTANLRRRAGLLRKMEEAGGVVTSPSYELMEQAAAYIESLLGRQHELVFCGNALRTALRSHSQPLGAHEIETWDEVVKATEGR